MVTKDKTPDIKFENGIMSIAGRSVPYDSAPIYKPLIDSFFDYSRCPDELTEINIQLEYINSDSSRSLMNLFVIVEKLFHRGHHVKVNWYYNSNNLGIYEQGNIFGTLVDLPFNFIKL
jgi:hypothetical protein